MKKIILFTMAMACLQMVAAQQFNKQEKGYFNVTEFGYFKLRNNFEFKNNSGNTVNGIYSNAYGISLRTINGIFINNNISIGLGVGLENYTLNGSSESYDNFFQVFADTRYYFENERNTFFAFGQLGGSVALDDNIAQGAMFNAGGGYKFMVAKRTAFLASIGLLKQHVKDSSNTDFKIIIKDLRLR